MTKVLAASHQSVASAAARNTGAVAFSNAEYIFRNDMENDHNPYQPPTHQQDGETLWDVFLDLFRSESQITRRRFQRGAAFLCEGIAFFVDPDNEHVLYAASASGDDSDSRMNLIVSEVIRILPQFRADYPEFNDILIGRTLIVRMIHSYYDDQSQFIREQAIDWNLL